MDTPRKLKFIIDPHNVTNGTGVQLRRSFSPCQANPFDPFLLFDHFSFKAPQNGPVTGFPTHPHRGIETVTYMVEGFFRHRDSLGHAGTIGPGDVQWVTSGHGILHEEMPRTGPEGKIDGFQLWINLPATQKMTRPRYQRIPAETIPTITQEGVTMRLIAGEYQDKRGPVSGIAANPIYIDISIEPDTSFVHPIPEEYSAAAYLFEGEAVFGQDKDRRTGKFIKSTHMMIFTKGDHIRIQTGPGSAVRFILIAGIPFNEPIYPQGPFVMNTREETLKAFEDLRNGTFVDNQLGMLGA